MPVINVEITAAIKIKGKKDVQRIRNLVQSFCEVLIEDFPDCKCIHLCIYDNKETIKKMLEETSAN